MHQNASGKKKNKEMRIRSVSQDRTNQRAPHWSPYGIMTKNGSEPGSQSEDTVQGTSGVVTKYENEKADSQSESAAMEVRVFISGEHKEKRRRQGTSRR